MNKRKLLKAYPFLEEVDSSALKVAWEIYKIRPHWLGYGETYADHDVELRLRFICPIDSTWKMVLETINDDIIVSYYSSYGGFSHNHYRRLSTTPIERAVVNAITFMDELMHEKWVVGYRIEDNHPVGLAYRIEEIPNINPNEVHYIRSWLGTYDRNFLEEGSPPIS
jgi:hypothetical protein